MTFTTARGAFTFVPFAGRVVVGCVDTDNHRAINNAIRWRARA